MHTKWNNSGLEMSLTMTQMYTKVSEAIYSWNEGYDLAKFLKYLKWSENSVVIDRQSNGLEISLKQSELL